MEEVAFEEHIDLATFAQKKRLLLSRTSLLEVVNPVKVYILRVEWNISSYSALINVAKTNSRRFEIV